MGDYTTNPVACAFAQPENSYSSHRRRNEVVVKCEELYDAAKLTAEKALWSRGAEKTSRLALLYAISENVRDPLITDAAV